MKALCEYPNFYKKCKQIVDELHKRHHLITLHLDEIDSIYEKIIEEENENMTYEQALELNAKLQNSDVRIPQIPNENVQKDYLFLCEQALKSTIHSAEFDEILYRHLTRSELTWQQRFQEEYRETKERYDKLHRMVTKYEAGTLDFTPNCSLDLLRQQKKHMGEYLHDLEIRAEIESIEL